MKTVPYDAMVSEEEFILNVTENIIKRMDEIGMNRKTLAERLGVVPPRITYILDGANITLRSLVRIARALDVTVYDLMQRSPSPDPGESFEEGL